MLELFVGVSESRTQIEENQTYLTTRINASTMEKVNTLNRMAQYDFGTPINVTMIFEDDSDEESSSKNEFKEIVQATESAGELLKLTEKTNVTQNECNSDKNTTITPKVEIQTLDLTGNETAINCINDSTDTKKKTQSNNCPSSKKTQRSNDINTLSKNDRQHDQLDKPDHDLLKVYQHINDNEKLTTHVRELLNTLSEHIILIMQSYYNHYYKNQNQPLNPDTVIKLSNIKKHFFDLSYSSVVTIILPQEHNEELIKKFIDKTVNDANKVMKWKCGRQHVERVYKEMVEWTKKRKEYIKKLHIPNEPRVNNNTVLKEHLTRPLRPLNFSHSTGAPLSVQNNNELPTNTGNATCIFSYGNPGSEISINVNPDTLIKHRLNNLAKHWPTNEMQLNTNSQLPPKSAMHYNPRSQHVSYNMYNKNTAGPYPVQRRVPPPPYGGHNQNHIIIPTTPDSPRHNINNVQEHAAHTMFNCEIQRNINQYISSPHNNSNFGNKYQQYWTQNVEEQATEGPVITNVTSLNERLGLMHGRCFTCGNSICDKFTYCSSLCQELDLEYQKSACGKT